MNKPTHLPLNEPQPVTIETVPATTVGDQVDEPVEHVDPDRRERRCEHCGAAFEPRHGAGGKPQRFCSAKCRAAFHAATPTSSPTSTAPSTTLASTSEPKSDFDWIHDDAVVLRHQPTTAIYWNPLGEVVIRQEGHYGPDEDQFVHITAGQLGPVIARLQAMQRESEAK